MDCHSGDGLKLAIGLGSIAVLTAVVGFGFGREARRMPARWAWRLFWAGLAATAVAALWLVRALGMVR